jgi:hypothetical protein
MELKESSERMVTPRVVTRNETRVSSKQIPSLVAVRKVASCGDLKGLGLEVKILLMLQVSKNSSELERGKRKNQRELHEEFRRL